MNATLEKHYDDLILAFVRRALKKAIKVVLMSKINEEEVKIVFDAALIQRATSPILLQAMINTIVIKEAIMAPVARFVACQACNEICEAAQQFIAIAPP